MQIKGRDSGSLTSITFSVVILISAVSLTFFVFVSFSFLLEDKYKKQEDQRNEIEKMLREVIQSYLDDATPLSDSPRDVFWETYHDYDENGIKITIQEISSAIPLNSVDPDIILQSKLDRYLSATLNRKSFISLREEIKWTTDITLYKDLFLGDEWSDDYTLYHYNNVNTMEEKSLQNFLKERLGNEDLMATLLLERTKEYITEAEFIALTGDSYNSIHTLAGTEPVINVHFARKEVLEAVFQALYGKESNSKYPYQNIQDNILAQRMVTEIAPENLTNLLKVDKENLMISFYLGVKSYFWTVTISDGTNTLRAILFTPPVQESKSLQVINREWIQND